MTQLLECSLCVLEHSGPPDPLHGSAPYLSVRQEAKVRNIGITFNINTFVNTHTPSVCHVAVLYRLSRRVKMSSDYFLDLAPSL